MSRDDTHRKHKRKLRRRAAQAEAERRQRLGLPLFDTVDRPERAARDPRTRWQQLRARGGLEPRFTDMSAAAAQAHPHLQLVYDADQDDLRGA